MAAYIQPIYAIPADGADQHLRPEIRWSIHDMQDWLAAQAGGRRLRIAGRVQFVRLREDAKTLDSLGVGGIRDELPIRGDVIYAVYYGGPISGRHCGYQIGLVAAVYLASCPGMNVPLTMLHEILHAIGIAHVTDCSCDLMWGGALFPVNPVLDYGHNDYWSKLLASPYLIYEIRCASRRGRTLDRQLQPSHPAP